MANAGENGSAAAADADNVSQKLRVRQQVAGWLRELVESPDAPVVEACHEALLAAGPDLLVMLGRYLETTDPQAVARLGRLAASYPDRPAIVAALRREALDPRHSDLKRMATMVVLEQFLEQELDDYYFSTLRDPAQIATNSLVQVLESAHEDRNLLLAYLSALEEQHPAALGTVLNSLGKLRGDQSVEILKLLAQHQDEDLADRARGMLAALRTGPALRALRMLELVAPLGRREKIGRVLRKLQMAGAELPGWDSRPFGARALLTGVDGAGAAALWFVIPRGGGQVQLLSLLLSDTRGVTDAFGGDSFSAESFPPPAPLGTIHQGLDSRAAPGDSRPPGARAASTDPPPFTDRLLIDLLGDDLVLDDAEDIALYLAADDAEADFLEVDFDYGRRLVRAHQEINATTGTPLPWEYRLLHDLIWRFGPVDQAPVPVSVPRAAPGDPASLLTLPYFAGWRLEHEAIYALAEEVLARSGGRLLDLPLPGTRWAADPPPDYPSGPFQAALSTLAARHFTSEVCAFYRQRLCRSADWLRLSGDWSAADLTLAAAAQLDTCPAAENPFLLALVERSVLLAARNLLIGYDPRTALTP
jgi:hypothetical protein